MLAVERRACIKETIQEQKSVAVSDLARRFDVTEETIRRDLKVLEAQGVLTRTYGGAFIQGGAINEVDVTLRETSYVEAKRQIAAQCLQLIRNGDSIFLDSSTTALEIARAIRDMRLTVLTNSLLIADVLSHSESIRLQVIGGVLQPQSMSSWGRPPWPPWRPTMWTAPLSPAAPSAWTAASPTATSKAPRSAAMPSAGPDGYIWWRITPNSARPPLCRSAALTRWRAL